MEKAEMLTEDMFHKEMEQVFLNPKDFEEMFLKGLGHVHFRAKLLYHEKYSHLPITVLERYEEDNLLNLFEDE